MSQYYEIVSPSLDGVLRHESMVYEGLRRPPTIDRIFDRLASSRRDGIEYGPDVAKRKEVLEEYFHDLYGILMKKISQFAIESEPVGEESVKLMAMLQEFVKVKRLLAEGQ